MQTEPKLVIRQSSPRGLRVARERVTPINVKQLGGDYFREEVQSVLRTQPIGQFLPRVEATEQPAGWVYTTCQHRGKTVNAADCRPLDRSAIPQPVLDELSNAIDDLQDLAADVTGQPESRDIAANFKLPDPEVHPQFYRICGWWNPTLVILWGCEKEAGTSLEPRKALRKLRRTSNLGYRARRVAVAALSLLTVAALILGIIKWWPTGKSEAPSVSSPPPMVARPQQGVATQYFRVEAGAKHDEVIARARKAGKIDFGDTTEEQVEADQPVNHRFMKPGNYRVEWTPRSSEFNAEIVNVTVRKIGEVGPIASLELQPANPHVGVELTAIDNSAHNDPAASLTSREISWDSGGSFIAWGPDSRRHTYQAAGPRDVILRVKDNRDRMAEDRKHIEVSPAQDTSPSIVALNRVTPPVVPGPTTNTPGTDPGKSGKPSQDPGPSVVALNRVTPPPALGSATSTPTPDSSKDGSASAPTSDGAQKQSPGTDGGTNSAKSGDGLTGGEPKSPATDQSKQPGGSDSATSPNPAGTGSGAGGTDSRAGTLGAQSDPPPDSGKGANATAPGAANPTGGKTAGPSERPGQLGPGTKPPTSGSGADTAKQGGPSPTGNGSRNPPGKNGPDTNPAGITPVVFRTAPPGGANAGPTEQPSGAGQGTNQAGLGAGPGTNNQGGPAGNGLQNPLGRLGQNPDSANTAPVKSGTTPPGGANAGPTEQPGSAGQGTNQAGLGAGPGTNNQGGPAPAGLANQPRPTGEETKAPATDSGPGKTNQAQGPGSGQPNPPGSSTPPPIATGTGPDRDAAKQAGSDRAGQPNQPADADPRVHLPGFESNTPGNNAGAGNPPGREVPPPQDPAASSPAQAGSPGPVRVTQPADADSASGLRIQFTVTNERVDGEMVSARLIANLEHGTAGRLVHLAWAVARPGEGADQTSASSTENHLDLKRPIGTYLVTLDAEIERPDGSRAHRQTTAKVVLDREVQQKPKVFLDLGTAK